MNENLMSTESTTSPRVVVGVDGSEHSQLALTWAASFAAVIGGSIDVVTVLPPPTSYDWSMATDGWDPAQGSDVWLAEVVDDALGARGRSDLQLYVRQGNVARVLLSMSESATMLVVGRRGVGGFAGLRLGSVSAHCAEYAHCPVLIVRGDRLAESAASAPSDAEI